MQNQNNLQTDNKEQNSDGQKELDRTNWNRGRAITDKKDSVNSKVVPPGTVTNPQK